MLSIPNVREYVKRCLEPRKAFFLGFGLSNLGKFDFEIDQSDPISLDSFYFSGSRRAADLVLFLCVTNYKGTLFLNFNYTKPLLSESWIHSFADNYIDYLNNIQT